jgi:alanine racemase
MMKNWYCWVKQSRINPFAGIVFQKIKNEPHRKPYKDQILWRMLYIFRPGFSASFNQTESLSYRIEHIAQIVEGRIMGTPGLPEIHHLVIDSRKIIFPETSVFFALKGPQHNGHQFIEKAALAGVKNFIVSEVPIDWQKNDSCFVLVKDTQVALQQLAQYHRRQFDIPVVGITGSNGKTIVKDWLSFVLSRQYNLCKNPKSYNSQVGVPLSVWHLQPENEIGIFEAGISQPGEMKNLEPIILPTLGIFTNIGSAHEENFNTMEEKLREKIGLFKNCTHLIFSNQNPSIETEIEKIYPDKLCITWGEAEDSVYKVSHKKNAGKTEIFLTNGDENYTFFIPYTDGASIENAVNVFLTALVLHADMAVVTEQMAVLPQINMRLAFKTGKNNCFIIDDTYSNDFDSLKIAIDSLSNLTQYPKKTIILSNIAQSQKNGAELYKNIADILTQKHIQRMIGIGKEIGAYQNLFPSHSLFFEDVHEFLENLPQIHFFNEAILVKGARVFEMEKIVTRLENKVHDTVLEVNLNAMVNNLNYYRSKISRKTKIMAMVKASGYGTGTHEIAHVLNFHHVDYLGVAYADEAIELRNHGIDLPIMVMNAEASPYDLLVEKKLEPVIYNFENLFQLFEYKKNGGEVPPIHIELDTGMHRLGFDPTHITQLTDLLKTQNQLEIKSVFSHLAASDEEGMDDFTLKQIKSFKNMTAQIEQAVQKTFIKHIANSAGASRFTEASFDMIRLGVGLYGVGANTNEQFKLQPVIGLLSTIAQITQVKRGESIGYGRSYMAQHDMTIATIPIGYADGYRRSLGNGKGKMFVQGQPAAVVGRVCMDMTMIDITGLNVEVGEKVEIIGENQPIEKFAQTLDTIPYEVLTSISQRVRRVYTQE